MGANFYLTEEDVGVKTRAQASVNKLRELNNYVKVGIVEAELGLELFEGYDCVCFTEIPTSIEDIIFWNSRLRNKNKTTILTQSLGLYGYVFADFGENHILTDENGERTQIFNIHKIEKKIGHDDPK